MRTGGRRSPAGSTAGHPGNGAQTDRRSALLRWKAWQEADEGIGRFIQPDSIVPDPMNPQSLNRYSYVFNNPLRYTDPTGRCGVSARRLDAITPKVITS